MKKILALGVLATFFLAPAVQAQDWHRGRGSGRSYQNHRQHQPARGHFNYQRSRHHRPQNWGQRHYRQSRQHRPMNWGNRYYRGNRSYQRPRHYQPSRWGHNNYRRWGNNNYHRSWNNWGRPSRPARWGSSPPNWNGAHRSRGWTGNGYRNYRSGRNGYYNHQLVEIP